MLNIFPIQFLAPLAYFLLRLCVGIILIRLGVRHLENRNRATINMNVSSASKVLFVSMGITELLAGILILLGAYTQIGALIALASTSIQLLRPRAFTYLGYPSRMFFFLLLTSLASLFITGAGAFAFDLPL